VIFRKEYPGKAAQASKLLPCACELNRDIYFHKSPYDLKCTEKPVFLEKSGFCSSQIQV